ncbi:signal recognition particle, SRP9/SRP14 subunit [Thamnocephalis sphaerospora]|uniref:Signal recognition particle subunit SRP14 n=1 Tax=Thamnocephalis sphaerospora TaxID=78915 RepID=A0A4P9XL36_9FUNG|nr:signal recognition particle, SRP9/SRP14 subunit [Thamnocephalis sphaerospora]|eukprot:RKP06492.1 signal recognition particle, SRP9/SRP14 subunit [Thamnocephalis sphaerospora]
MTLLDNDQFIAQLPELFASSRKNGTVYLTQKRMTPRKPAKDDAAMEQDPEEFACIWRAVCGKKKLSTVVQAKEQARFLVAYAGAIRSQATSLKKKERKRKRGAGGATATNPV